MPSLDNRPSLAALKAKKAPPQILTKTIKVSTASVRPSPTVLARSLPTKNGVLKRHASTPIHKNTTPVRKSSTPINSSISPNSRPGSREPLERMRDGRSNRPQRSSPAVSTPRLTSSDEDSDEENEQPRKRIRLERRSTIDTKRTIRDHSSFTDGNTGGLPLIHAFDVANSELVEQSRDKYSAFFTALKEEEDECPTVDLQYPSASQTERYQLVKPNDLTDFKPLSEIMDNMKIVADYYMDEKSAETITCEEDGSGLVELLQRYAKEGQKGRAGAQGKFMQVVDRYNSLLIEKRKDGTIAKTLDQMTRVPMKLVEHIIKNQVYARTVSPQVHLVRHYESFSDNVYGELLPKFLSKIFEETHLKSDQIFVDLGSGVGNCVLQAALEIGCESWGCEMMDNPDALAQLQAKEFPARCRLWGIKPGKVRLVHDDFLVNDQIRQVLKKADVVLINNQAFTAILNDKLKYMFLDLKEGCQIVSLKYYRDPQHKIKETNINDPVNLLTVEERERWSGMVSWTDDPGKWYLHRKDSSILKAFEKRLDARKV